MLIESGKTTTVEYISNTKPIPNDKPLLAGAHALAAELMGMRWIYLEAGSGALQTVPASFIKTVKKMCHCFVIVGGGISSPEIAVEKVRAGADMIVIGTHFEKMGSDSVQTFASAIREANK